MKASSIGSVQNLARLASGILLAGGVQIPVSAQTQANDPAGVPASAEAVAPETIPVQEAAAPESAATTEPAAARSRVIEEIVVTAQRREENLQDVPISVSAFSSEKLEALGVENAQDLQLVTPGLVYANTAINYALIYIRGIGTDVFIPSADSSVATYLDGVYFPYAHGLASSFTELERIEVLKGPQGTLFGRNTTGGAINIVTRKPSDHFEAKLSGTLGDYNQQAVRGYVNVPIGENFAISLAALYKDEDSYYKPADLSPVQTQPTHTDKGAHLKLRYDFSDDLSLELAGLQTRSFANLINSIEDTKAAGLVFRPRDTKPYEYSSDVDGHLKSDNKLAYATLGWQTDALNVKLFGSYQKVEGATLYDFDGGPIGGVYFDVPDEFVRAKTGEFQLQSTPGGWLTFSDSVNWTLGYYYFDSIGGYGSVYFGVLNPSPEDGGGAPLNLFGGVLDAVTIPLPVNAEVKEKGTVDTRSHALYGQATWAATDWFGITLGGRLQRERRATVISGASVAINRTPSGEIPLFVYAPQSTTTENFSPKVTFDFRPFGDDTLLYTSWQKGFKSGTYNVVSLNLPPSYVKPEKVTSIEAGIKGKLLDGSFVYNAALFHNRIDDLQTLAISLTSGGTSQLANAAQATIKGADFDITWQMFPDLLPGFALTASGTYLDGKYDSYPEGAGFLQQLPQTYCGPGALVGVICPAGAFDFSGNTTVRTPTRSGTLGLSQTLEVPGGTMELGVNATYNSGYYFDAQNTTTQPQYTLINARVSYLYEPYGLRVSAFVSNLTDELYYSDKLLVDFGVNAYLAPPRTYGFTVAWEYGN